MPRSLREQYPLRLFFGSEDVTFLLDSGATWSSVDPGGFESASFAIPKDMPQSIRGTNVRLDCGLKVAWEGRISQPQRSLGHRTQIQCEGYGSLLKDNEGSMVFVDRDLTKWAGPSVARQIVIVGFPRSLGNSSVAADPTSLKPAVVQSISGGGAQAGYCEAWYDAGSNNLIARIYYDLTLDASVGGAAFSEKAALSNDANGTTQELSSNLNSVSETAGYFQPATAYRFAFLNHFYTGTLPGPAGTGQPYNAYWHNTAVYGNHGLPGRGADPVGYYPSDVVSWALSQTPGLQAGTVQQTDAGAYILAHSAYYTPVTLDRIVSDMAIAQGWHWGVWEAPTLTGTLLPRLDFRPRPPSGAFTASCYRRDCDTLDIREDLSQQYNQAVVTYSNTSGQPDSVTVTLDNPILDQAGIGSRTLIINMGVATAATAQVFGLLALTETCLQGRVAGTASIIAAIDGPGAPWLLRPGIDRLRIIDAPCTDAFGQMSDYPLARVESSLSSSGIATNVELGSGASLIETLNARVQAATALAGSGG